MVLEIGIPNFFDRDSLDFKLIKSIIKEQESVTCRNELSNSYISDCLQTFTAGYIIVGNISNNSKRGSSGKYVLKGFVLFCYDEFSTVLSGKILCGRKSYSGTGIELLNCVQSYAKNVRATRWEIYSLPYEKLMTYYENFGFTRGISIYKSGKLKVVQMAKTFEYEDESCEESENESEEEK